MFAQVIETLMDAIAILTGQPHGRRAGNRQHAPSRAPEKEIRARHGRARKT